jgi:4-amino-4-deoxychorismate lyase
MNERGIISARGSQYGDGLFETIAIRDGNPRLWTYHLERLQEGCKRLGFEAPEPAALHERLNEALSTSDADSMRCVAKLVVSAASQGRGYGRSVPSPTETWAGVFPATALARSDYANGISTTLCETRLATGSPVAGLKTLNRLEQVLARAEFAESSVLEGLTCDADGRIICGTMSNVFIVRNNQVLTPSLERCGVSGIMRRLVIEESERAGLPVVVADFSADELGTADEVFITNSQLGAVPVRNCDEHRWPVGPVTRRVIGMLFERGIEECRP